MNGCVFCVCVCVFFLFLGECVTVYVVDMMWEGM